MRGVPRSQGECSEGGKNVCKAQAGGEPAGSVRGAWGLGGPTAEPWESGLGFWLFLQAPGHRGTGPGEAPRSLPFLLSERDRQSVKEKKELNTKRPPSWQGRLREPWTRVSQIRRPLPVENEAGGEEELGGTQGG